MLLSRVVWLLFPCLKNSKQKQQNKPDPVFITTLLACKIKSLTQSWTPYTCPCAPWKQLLHPLHLEFRRNSGSLSVVAQCSRPEFCTSQNTRWGCKGCSAGWNNSQWSCIHVKVNPGFHFLINHVFTIFLVKSENMLSVLFPEKF